MVGRLALRFLLNWLLYAVVAIATAGVAVSILLWECQFDTLSEVWFLIRASIAGALLAVTYGAVFDTDDFFEDIR